MNISLPSAGPQFWRSSRNGPRSILMMAPVSEIVADLRDDLIEALYPIVGCLAAQAADASLEAIKNWCAKEPANDN